MVYLESRDLVHRFVIQLTCINYEAKYFMYVGVCRQAIYCVRFVDCLFLCLHNYFLFYNIYYAEIWLQEMSWYQKIILRRYFELICILYCIIIEFVRVNVSVHYA